jgi:hypothetical protein
LHWADLNRYVCVQFGVYYLIFHQEPIEQQVSLLFCIGSVPDRKIVARRGAFLWPPFGDCLTFLDRGKHREKKEKWVSDQNSIRSTLIYAKPEAVSDCWSLYPFVDLLGLVQALSKVSDCPSFRVR